MNGTSNAVILPCSTQDFGSFISGLLGKPQTISNMISGPFEIAREEVLNVHALLMQRVAQQNDATLTQFTAKLVFNDDSSVLLNSIADFESYAEVRPVACLALHLSWVFLVKFNDKKYPEKQQIDLSFLGGNAPPLIDKDTPVVMLHDSDAGYIGYRISHTARTWGSDIDSLLSAHLKGVVDEIPPFRKWLAKNDGKISVLAFSALFFASIIGTFFAITSFLREQKEEVTKLTDGVPMGTVTQEQVMYLIDTVASGTWERFLLVSMMFLLLSFVVAIVIAVWVGVTADNLPPSFLLLTKESERRKNKILARRKAKWLSFLAAVCVGVATGVGGNITYALWFEHLIKP